MKFSKIQTKRFLVISALAFFLSSFGAFYKFDLTSFVDSATTPNTAYAAAYACSPSSPTVNVNQNVTFTAAGGNGTGFFWLSGDDGSTGSGPTYVKSYATAGTKTMYVSESSDSFSTFCTVVVEAGLTCSPSSQSVDVNSIATFSASGGTAPYAWNANGGTPNVGSGVNFNTSYASTGSKSVILTDNNNVQSTCDVTVGVGAGSCGDGIIQAGAPRYEFCDDGAANGPSPASCSTTCGPNLSLPSGNIEAYNTSTSSWTSTNFTITSGTATSVRWTSSGATSCSVTTNPVDGSAGLPSSLLQNASYPSGQSTGNLSSAHTYRITCSDGSGNSFVDTVQVSVNVASDFSLTCNTVTQTIAPGGIATYSINVNSVGGFNNNVNMSASGLPSGGSGVFVPNPVRPPANGTRNTIYTLTTTGATPPGLYNPITITGTRGALSHSCPVQLIVTGGAPTCSSAGPDGVTTTQTSGSYDVYAYNVTNSSAVSFAVWTLVNGQDDLVWYPGTNQGGGTWKATANLATHDPAGSLGQVAIHVYMTPLAGPPVIFCDTADFIRVAPASVTADIKANGSDATITIPSSTAFSLSWSSANASSCSTVSNPAGFSSIATSNPGVLVTPTSTTTDYTTTCQGTGGPATDTVRVQISDFSLTCNTLTQTVVQGSPATYSVNVNSQGIFSNPVTMDTQGLPAGTTDIFSPNPVDPPPAGSLNTILTVTTTLATPAGTYAILATGTDAPTTKTCPTQLIVTSAVSSPPTATMNCNGGSSCSVATGGTVVLSWSSTDTTSCTVTSNPNVYSGSGLSNPGVASGSLTVDPTIFNLDCSGPGGSVQSIATATVTGSAPNIATSDKDLIRLNGSVINSSGASGNQCSGSSADTLTYTSVFKAGDTMTFKINICNTGTSNITNLSLTDRLANLSNPGNYSYNGCSSVPVVGTGGSSPNQIITFTGLGDLAPGGICSINMTATVAIPSGNPAFFYVNNQADIASSNNPTRTVATPFFVSGNGTKVPTRREVAP